VFAAPYMPPFGYLRENGVDFHILRSHEIGHFFGLFSGSKRCFYILDMIIKIAQGHSQILFWRIPAALPVIRLLVIKIKKLAIEARRFHHRPPLDRFPSTFPTTFQRRTAH
jgi:hypothetical protein